MITVADIRSYDSRIDPDTAHHIAAAWNTSYPHLRAALTAVVNNNRQYLADAERWELSEDKRADTIQRIKDTERTRRELGQLDRAGLRMCARSGGGFSVVGALTLVQQAIGAFPWDSPHLGDAFRLAAALADVIGARTASREAARPAPATDAT